MADNVTGIVLDIPADVLQNIKNADKAIKDLEATSRHAAQKVKGHFDNTMVSGVNAFIKKVQEAQTKLGSVKMPTIDATGLSAAVQELSRAMSTIDKSATTGSNRLTRIADAMSALQTANPNPQLFQNIADGIAKIGNTSQQTIDNVRNLSQIMAQLARDIRTVQQAQAAQNANTASAAQYNKLYKEQADLIRQITALKGKGTAATATDIAMLRSMENRYAEINKQLGELNRKKQTAASILAQNLGMERTNRATPSGAIAYAQQAKSLQELQAAYKNLKAVMATVDPKTSAWQQMNVVLGQTRTRIDEIKKKMGEFKSTAQGVGDIAGQLKRSMAAAFSVSAIYGYINKMTQVRAEFEMQQTALRAILQNKDEADRIFMQVQQMAMQSPFSILQLTTYTKQLAAYRIESEKLLGTTKMLADVSAGLGVDIGRLILAYGQVKAANYLRATEVRQFTEAGLNIAGELAQYFSELQGKMISVGDVMEMITKRMVRFEDVEEVFKRVTSAGGLFYDMQKKQSETLKGQLQRINDAMSIMFNEIGKSNQDAISAVLTTIRSLISNWRTLAVIIKDAALAMGIFFAAKGIGTFVSYLPMLIANVKSLVAFIKLATTSWQAFGAAAKSVMTSLSATGWGAIIAGVALLVTTIYQAVTATSALQEELSRIGEESMTDMFDLTAKFKEMANVVRDATAPYEERKKALEDLHNTFKNILPAEMLELENIQKMSDGYKEATEAIRVFSAEQARRKAMEAVQQDMAKQFQEAIDDAKDAMDFDTIDFKAEEIKGIVANIMRQIQAEIADGTLKTIDEVKARFKELSKMRFGVDLASVEVSNAKVFDKIAKMMTNARIAAIEFDEEYTTVMENTSKADRAELQKWQDNYQLRIDAINRLKKALEDMRELESKGELYGKSETHPEDKRGLTDEGIAATDELLKATNAVNSYRESVGLLPLAWQDVKDATISATNELTFLDGVQKTTLGGFLGNLSNIGGNKAVQGWAQDTTRKLEGLSAPQLDIINKGELILSQFKLQPQLLDKLKISAETNYASAAKDAKGLSDQSADNIAKITSTMLAIIKLGQMSGKVVTQAQAQAQAEQMWGITLDQAKKEKNAWDLMAKMLGEYDKAKKKSSRKGEDAELKRWKDIQKAIDEANKSYEKYRAKYNVAEANKMIEDQYGKIFKELGVDIKTFYKNGTYDAEQLVKALGVLRGMVKLTTKDRQRYATELAEGIEKEEVEIKLKAREEDLKKFKQDINSIFDNYELSQTFAKLGVNIDVVYSLGGKPTKLSDIKRQLADMKEKIGGKEGAEDEYKAIEEAQQRLGKLEQKYAVERAKNYVKYLTESLAERAQIEVKAMQDINKIQEDMSLDAFSKEQAINNRRKKMNEDLAKVDFDEFKASDVYISVFKDLEQASRTQLQYVINKLREFQSTYKDLSPTQVKAIAKALKETEGALAKQNAFKDIGKNLKEAIKYARERQALQEQQVYTQVTIDSLVKSEAEQSKDLADAQLRLKGIQDKNSDEYKTQEALVKSIQLRLSGTQGLLGMQRKKQQGITEQIEEGEESLGRVRSLFANLSDKIGQVKNSLDTLFDGLDSMGFVSDSFRDTYESMSDIIGGIQSTLEGLDSIDLTKPFSAITGGVKVLGGVFQTIAGFFMFGDKKKERQIKRLQEHVEKLQKDYEKLGNEIKRAYEYNDYKAGYEQSLKNLEEQKKAIQEQINLEKSKKKVDEDKVKEYEDALEKLAEDERSRRNQFYEDWGSYGDDQIKSAGEDFVSTWLDAFKETGDGIDALTGKWDEFFENLIMRQAASAVVNRKLKKYIDRINAVLDSNGLSEAETAARMKEIIDAAKNEASTMNEQLKNWFSALGIKGGQGELLLSDLQKGIQNITEPQAAAIEAYLNSMRFAVFEQNNILSSMLEAIQAQYGTGTDNPILSEVKAIRSLVADIDNKLSKVIVNRNSTTGNYIVKVG